MYSIALYVKKMYIFGLLFLFSVNQLIMSQMIGSMDPILANSTTTPDPPPTPRLDPPTTGIPLLATAANPPPDVPGGVTNAVVVTFPRHEPFMFVGPYSLNKKQFFCREILTIPASLTELFFLITR